MSKFDKRVPKMQQTKFGDHPSISTVETMFKGFSIFSFRGPFRGQANLICANLIKDCMTI
jgi:hypothetical protein